MEEKKQTKGLVMFVCVKGISESVATILVIVA